jgi:peptidoglycan/LPS O-acetylase OafA/YrhL
MLPGIIRIEPIIVVAWSLSYELVFYLSIPILINCLGMRNWNIRYRVGFFMILIAGFTFFYAFGIVGHHRLIMFGAGIILWEFVQVTNFPSILRNRGELISITLFLANLAVIGWYGTHTMDTQLVLATTKWWYSAGLFITGFWLSSFALAYNGYLKTFFSCLPLRWLGNMSYSYYLIHGITLQGLRSFLLLLLPSPPHSSVFFGILLFLSIVSTIATSFALFLLIEKPFSITLKKAEGFSSPVKITKERTGEELA